LIKGFIFGLLLASTLHAQEKPALSLQKLIDGNTRFVKNKAVHPDESTERRRMTADQQTPFAIILGCSDSRVSPEIVFDQGIGDLFVVRVAGNIVTPVVLDSICYSANNLQSSIVLVLGHEHCGAVSAVLNGKGSEIPSINRFLAPAIAESKTQKGDRLVNAIKDNVENAVDQIRAYPAIAKLIEKKQIDVRGGYYNFLSGKVHILP
jgi:carbonic anhydrase